jgi:hypothetical protein
MLSAIMELRNGNERRSGPEQVLPIVAERLPSHPQLPPLRASLHRSDAVVHLFCTDACLVLTFDMHHSPPEPEYKVANYLKLVTLMPNMSATTTAAPCSCN